MSNQMTDKQMIATLSRNLKRLMKEQDMKQKDLALLCDTAEASISKYLNRKAYPSGTMLVRLARALNTTVEALMA